ncbi:MAG: HD domain-containing protein [Anaerolineae bacterium]|jgi:putative nucleotidyltransferase with HDIG domain|nr:HD domain-containing protein [Anaerolineae bacterium]MDH7474060.1 HD domain-containing protein [Anaerolineae bacterium]
MSEFDMMGFFPPNSLIERVAHFVREQGIETYLVGGCVRDALLGRSSRDFDFVVLGRALPLARRVANHFGAAFYALDAERDTGRVIFRLNEGQEQFCVDFAAARGGSIIADLALRDFTINAIAVHLNDGQLVDPHNGRADLSAGVLRAVSDCAFRDDPLRTMRGVRLAVELGFEMEPRTEALLRQAVPLLAEVSAERARDEFCKLLSLPKAANSLERLSELGLLGILLPEVEAMRGVTQSAPHQLDVFGHSLESVRWMEEVIAAVQPGRERELVVLGLSALNRFPLAARLTECISDERTRATLLKLAALLHDVGKPATRTVKPNGYIHFLTHEVGGAALAGQMLARLRFSVQEVRLVQTVVANHMRTMFMSARRIPSRREIYRFFRDTGESGVDVALVALADHRAVWGTGLEPDRWAHLVKVVTLLLTHWYEQQERTIAPPKLISGHDLMERFGLEEGPRIGELLEAVREAQVMDRVHTREEALAWVAQILDK